MLFQWNIKVTIDCKILTKNILNKVILLCERDFERWEDF